ncbi:MAG: hypothetical protein JO112_05805 [Planctomycetes bacterium]|nr:hypothetical protein [Planctomycetota bacterium]
MNSLGKVSVALGVVLLLTQVALAQRFQGRPGGRGGFNPGPLGLLQSEAVQKELNLTDDQVQQIQKIAAGSREKHRDDFQKLRDVEEADRPMKLQELRKTMNDEDAKALAGLLKPEQEKRLKQLTIQREGYRAFSDPEVQKELNLTDDQKTQIQTITTDAGKETRDLFQGGGAPSQDSRKKMQEIQKQTTEKVQSVLTDTQKKTWKELTGEPFEFPRGQFGPGGGGRRPRGGV